MDEKTIILRDGTRKTVTGHVIHEFMGDVYVFTEETDAVSVLVGETDYEKYEGAKIE